MKRVSRNINEFYKVSVIVPVYNVELYLEQCVYSLINQTYRNIEIILVNDGSKDNSGEICESFLDKDQRISVVHKENEGLGFARNTGLDYASGEFVTFIDSDDYAEEDMIELLIDGIIKYSADTCIGGFKRVNNNGRVLYTEKYQESNYQGCQVYQDLFQRMLGSAPDKHDSIRMSVWNSMYSMKIIKENNILFPSERVMISEDIIFDSDYYRYAECVCVIDSTAYNYRVTQGSLTQKYKADRAELTCILYDEMEQRISGVFEGDIALHRLQKQFFVNIRMCLSQEKRKVSGKSFNEVVSSMNKICEMSTLQKVVNSYPNGNLKLNARIFVLLIKYKAAFTLALLTELDML